MIRQYKSLTYKIEYSNRLKRNCHFKFDKVDYMVVKAPATASESKVIKIVESDYKRLASIFKKSVENKYYTMPETIKDNEVISLMGEQFTILVVAGKEFNLDFNNSVLTITAPKHYGKRVLKMKVVTYFKDLSQNVLKSRLSMIAERLNLKYRTSRVGHIEGAWGHYSKMKNEIFLNENLIFAPIENIDATIYHELTHMTHYDHSRRFYNLLRQYNKDYLVHAEWNKENAKFFKYKILK